MKQKAFPVKDPGFWTLPTEADTQPVPGNLEGQESPGTPSSCSLFPLRKDLLIYWHDKDNSF